MGKLPDGYHINPERVPVPGASITEGMSLDELIAYRDEQARLQAYAEAKKDEDEILALTAVGLVLAALGGVIIHRKLKRKD